MLKVPFVVEAEMVQSNEQRTSDVMVVGAGIAGLYAAHYLLSHGFTVRVLERGLGLGGTWYWNRYPGARCDISCIDYSFGFSDALQNEWTWTERYAAQPELERYINYVADKFDLRRHIDLGVSVSSAKFDDLGKKWELTTTNGPYQGRFLIMATGPLSEPNLPQIPGLTDFDGPVFHSIRWPRDASLVGKRVGVIGTGSTGIQIIQTIAPTVGKLYVFQRSPNYVAPAGNYRLTQHEMMKIRETYPARRRQYRHSKGGTPDITPPLGHQSALAVPAFQREAVYEYMWSIGAGIVFRSAFSDIVTSKAANDTIADFIRRKIHKIVLNKDVANLLSPTDHPYASKRPPAGIGYYEAYNLANVQLVDVRSHPIDRVTSRAVKVGANEYEVDALILATGFDAGTGALTRIPIVGRDGVALSQKWKARASSYLGMLTAGFPNLFMVNGPGGPGTFTNNFALTEQNVEWIGDLLCSARSAERTLVEVTRAAEEKWSDTIDSIVSKTLYLEAKSWYRGFNVEGKSHAFVFYAGGFSGYCDACHACETNDYDGVSLR